MYSLFQIKVPGTMHLTPSYADKSEGVKNLDFADFRLFPISGFLGMREMLPGTFQDFNFKIFESQHF